MANLLQENANGFGLNNELYRVSANGDLTRIFSDWQRVGLPEWSPDGRRIAFVGTPDYASGTADSLSQIEALARYPWNLYLMDADETNIQEIQSDVHIGRIRWLNGSEQLSFAGTYREATGIWVWNTKTQLIVRIWPYAESYDFSPDGTQAVVLHREDFDHGSIFRPIIVQLP